MFLFSPINFLRCIIWKDENSQKRFFTGALDIYSNVGLFADVGGFGKTLSIVSLILREPNDMESRRNLLAFIL